MLRLALETKEMFNWICLKNGSTEAKRLNFSHNQLSFGTLPNRPKAVLKMVGPGAFARFHPQLERKGASAKSTPNQHQTMQPY
jgi:hypothetical protein